MSTWPHTELPGAGPLAECELDEACWRKRAVHIEPVHAAAMDECADWATRQRPACVGDCETAAGCSCCGGKCPTPQACEQPEDVHARQRRGIARVLMTAGAAMLAACLWAYLRAPT